MHHDDQIALDDDNKNTVRSFMCNARTETEEEEVEMKFKVTIS